MQSIQIILSEILIFVPLKTDFCDIIQKTLLLCNTFNIFSIFRLAYDPRRQLRVRDIARVGDNQDINKQQKHAVRAQELHFKIAEAQIAKAILLQECLSNPSSCQIES